MLGGTTGPLATLGTPLPPSVFPTALETAAAPESGVDVDGAGATGWRPWRTAGLGCGGLEMMWTVGSVMERTDSGGDGALGAGGVASVGGPSGATGCGCV